MEERDEANNKHRYNKYTNKKVETLEDLCSLLRNKTNHLYGDDEAMINMVTRLIEGKDAVNKDVIPLPAAINIPLRLI